MKKLWLWILLLLLTGCSASHEINPGTAASGPDTAAIPESVFDSYYLSSDESAYSYLQNNSIKRFFNMWVQEYLDEEIEVEWDYDSLAPVQLLDHDFNTLASPEDELYTCIFTTEDGRCGYIVVSYHEEDPSVEQWSLHESSPHRYDFRANEDELAAALAETDIDLATAAAVRAEWVDTKNNRGDRIILFTDGKDDRYIYYYGDDAFTIEKQ